MANPNQTKAIVYVETLIGDSSPEKGIPVDSAKFKCLISSSDIFSISPIISLSYLFNENDNKPKVYDELYIRVYKNLNDNTKGALIYSAALTILAMNVETMATDKELIEKYDYLCVSSSIYTLSHKMNVAYSNSSSEDVIGEIFKLKDNLSYKITTDPSYKTKDKMNWVFSQKTSLEILKKVLRHTNVTTKEKDIPLLFTNADKSGTLTTLRTLALKDSKCSVVDINKYDSIDDDDKKEYLKFTKKTVGKYKGAVPLLTNGFGENLYQYNPWADKSFGKGLIGLGLGAAQFIKDKAEEALNPLSYDFKHPDEVINKCVYRAYESFDFSVGTIMGGTPLKPLSMNSNISTLEYTGIHTKDLHDLYNVLPYIYENIVRNFFSNSVDIICNINSQNDRFKTFSEFPKLGDCVNLLFDTKNNNVDNIRNGKYLIGNYTIKIDGLYDVPVVKYTLYRDTIYSDNKVEDKK